MKTNKQLMTTAEVARFLNCSEKSVRRFLKNGDLEGSKLNNHWRIHPDDLDQFLENRKNTNEGKE